MPRTKGVTNKKIQTLEIILHNVTEYDYRQILDYFILYHRLEIQSFLIKGSVCLYVWLLFSICSGLVPLHNACSYGHYEVAELLVRHGASVNVADLWKFTPLHEAAAKGKYEICKLLLKVRPAWPFSKSN